MAKFGEDDDMNWKSTITPIFWAILFALGSSPPAYAAPLTDACSLLTQTQLSSVLGVPIGAGSHVTPTYLKTCTWAPVGSPTKDFKYLTLSFESADGYEAAKTAM
jgi:hypothetical protein